MALGKNIFEDITFYDPNIVVNTYYRLNEANTASMVNYGSYGQTYTPDGSMVAGADTIFNAGPLYPRGGGSSMRFDTQYSRGLTTDVANPGDLDSYLKIYPFPGAYALPHFRFSLCVDNADITGKEYLVAMAIGVDGSNTEFPFAITLVPVAGTVDSFGTPKSPYLKLKVIWGNSTYYSSLTQPSSAIYPGKTYHIYVNATRPTGSTCKITLGVNGVTTTATTTIGTYTYSTTGINSTVYLGGLPANLRSAYPNFVSLNGRLSDFAVLSGSVKTSSSISNIYNYLVESSFSFLPGSTYLYVNYPMNFTGYDSRFSCQTSTDVSEIKGNISRSIQWVRPPTLSTSAQKVHSQASDLTYGEVRIPALAFQNSVGKITNSTSFFNLGISPLATLATYTGGTAALEYYSQTINILVTPTAASATDQVILNVGAEYPWKLVLTGDNNTVYGPRKFILYPNRVAPASTAEILSSDPLIYNKNYAVILTRLASTNNVQVIVNGLVKYTIPWTLSGPIVPTTTYIGANDEAGTNYFTGLLSSFSSSIYTGSTPYDFLFYFPFSQNAYMTFNPDVSGSGLQGVPSSIRIFSPVNVFGDSGLTYSIVNNTLQGKPSSIWLPTPSFYTSKASFTSGGSAYVMAEKLNEYEKRILENPALAEYWKLNEGGNPTTLASSKPGGKTISRSGLPPYGVETKMKPIRRGATGSRFFLTSISETGILSSTPAYLTSGYTTNPLFISRTNSWAVECVYRMQCLYYSQHNQYVANKIGPLFWKGLSPTSCVYGVGIYYPNITDPSWSTPPANRKVKLAIVFDNANTATGGSGIFYTDPIIVIGKTNHIVLNRTPTEVALYLNGEKVWSRAVLETQVTPSNVGSTNSLLVGGGPLNTNVFVPSNGYMSDVALYTASLTEEDIESRQPFIHECFIEKSNGLNLFSDVRGIEPHVFSNRTYDTSSYAPIPSITPEYVYTKNPYIPEQTISVIPELVSVKPLNDNLVDVFTASSQSTSGSYSDDANSFNGAVNTYGYPGGVIPDYLVDLALSKSKTLEVIIRTKEISSFYDQTIIFCVYNYTSNSAYIPQYRLFISGSSSRHGSGKLILEGLDHSYTYPRQYFLPSLQSNTTYVITLAKAANSSPVKIYVNGSLYNTYTGWDYAILTTGGTYGGNRVSPERYSVYGFEYFSTFLPGTSNRRYTAKNQFLGYMVSICASSVEFSAQDVSSRYLDIQRGCDTAPTVIQGVEGTLSLDPIVPQKLGGIIRAESSSLKLPELNCWTYIRADITQEILQETQTAAEVRTNHSINSNLYPMTPNFVYLMQVKSVYEDLKKSKDGKKYIPLQFGGVDGQRIISDEALVLNISDFDFN